MIKSSDTFPNLSSNSAFTSSNFSYLIKSSTLILGISTSNFFSNIILLIFGFIILLLSFYTMNLKDWNKKEIE